MLKRDQCPGCGAKSISPLCSRKTLEAQIDLALCEGCGLVFVNPMFDDREKAEHSPDIRALHRSRSAELSDAAALARSRKRAARWEYAVATWLKPGSRVLEIGAGDGAMVELLLKHGHSVVALDPDADSCAYIGKRFGIKTHACRVEDLDIAGAVSSGEAFDAVFMLNLIEHLVDPAAVMRRLRELVIEGGVVGIETPNILRTKVGPRRMFSFPHNYYFSPESLQTLMELEGYEPVHVRVFPFDMFHMIVRKNKTTSRNTAVPARTLHFRKVRRAVLNHRWAYYLRGQYLLRKLPRYREWYLYGRYQDREFGAEATGTRGRAVNTI